MAIKKEIKADMTKALTPPDEKYYGDDLLQASTSLLPYGRRGLFSYVTRGVTNFYYAGREITPYGVDPKLRDYQLWYCVHTNSWVSSVVRNITIRLVNTPFKIKAKNPSIATHVEMAKTFNHVFWFGDPAIDGSQGWFDVSDKLADNVITQDNGGVLEILDSADNINRDGSLPRLGFGGFRFWDSSQVIRKSDDEYPVAILYKPEGQPSEKQYRLHKSRVFSIVDMPSTKPELNGIGYCAVSRATDFFTDLDNLTETKNENYGDGEADQLWLLKSDAIPQVSAGDNFLKGIHDDYLINRSNSGTQKTARRGFIEMPQNSDFEIVNARALPEGFDESTTIDNAMKGMASAFNVPLRFIWTITTRGLGDTSSADLDEEIAESGMFTWFNKSVIGQAMKKLLPANGSLDMVVDTENDKADLQASEIEKNLTESNSKQLADGAIDIRTYRLSLLDAGKLSQADFNRLELEDGRMSDGKPVVDLFYSPRYADVLTLEGIDDPLDVSANASLELIDLLGDKARQVKRLRELILDDGRRVAERERLLIAHTALTRLQSLYMERLESLEQDTDDTRPEQDMGEQSEDKALSSFIVEYQDEIGDKLIKKGYMSHYYKDGVKWVTTDKGFTYEPEHLLKKKTVKAVGDDLDLYERKLEQILLRTNNGEIDEDESQGRVSNLASAMLIIAFILGKREREDLLTQNEQALIAGARAILNNGGITQPNFTREQLERYRQGLETINSESLKAEVFTGDELLLLDQQTAINQESANGVVDWALNLTPVLVGLGLVGREFDDELKRRIINRVVKWRNKASIFVDIGKVAIRPNTLFRWQIGATEESCETCLFYNGQVKTGFEWFQLAINQGIYPRSSSLECGGWNCLCSTVRVNS